MKRFFAVILAVVILVCAVPSGVFAAQKDVNPLIILQGYSGPQLFYDLGGENEHQVWGPNMDDLKQIVIERIPELAGGLGGAAFGDFDLLVKTVGEGALELLEYVRCNPDGSSKYDLSVYPEGAAATRASTLLETGEDNYIAERPLAEDFMSEIGAENLFTFTVDWRMGQVENAAKLDKYIQEVKALTGSDKVNIYALSHGGQLGAVYLYYYGEKADVERIILNVPAIGGTQLVYDLMMGNGKFDIAALIEFVEIGFRNEDEWEWLVEAFGFERLNEAFYRLLQEYFLDIVIYWGSIWDFIPLDKYDEVKSKFLDPEENAQIIAKSDELHYNAMAHMSEGLKRAQDAGINIAIMSNTGRDIATSTGVNSDYIIDVHSSSGSNCAPYSESFPTDYEPLKITCSDSTHRHISPDRSIDATCAYLPDNTWFINGQYHGQSNWDRYTRSFYMEFLFGDSITDIYSNPDYPQFETAQNPADGLYVKFDATPSGFHTSKDTKLLIESLSEQYDTEILKIEASGADIIFKGANGLVLKPGESAEIEFENRTLPDSSNPFTLTVTYSLKNKKVPFIKTKTFSFTAMSDEEYDRYIFLSGRKDSAAPVNGNPVEESVLSPETGLESGLTAAAALAMGSCLLVVTAKRKKEN